jgi:hypothetical protein
LTAPEVKQLIWFLDGAIMNADTRSSLHTSSAQSFGRASGLHVRGRRHALAGTRRCFTCDYVQGPTRRSVSPTRRNASTSVRASTRCSRRAGPTG